MTDAHALGPWLRRFLEEYLVSERNLARNTQLSYRDTLVLLLRFAAAQARTPVDRLTVRDLGAERVRAFLAHLEQERGCSPRTPATSGSPPSAASPAMSPAAVPNTSPGVTRSAPFRSRRPRLRRSATWKSTRSTPYSMPRTLPRPRAGASAPCSCFSTTPELEHPRRRN